MDSENGVSGLPSQQPQPSWLAQSRLGKARLSQRETEVLQAISNGLSNPEIAGALQLSVETIKTHVRSILQKLNARDRTQAVVIALSLGIILLPASMNRDDTEPACALSRPASIAMVNEDPHSTL